MSAISAATERKGTDVFPAGGTAAVRADTFRVHPCVGDGSSGSFPHSTESGTDLLYGTVSAEDACTDGAAEMNTVIAVGVEAARELLKKGRGFCLAIPTRNRLQLYEIQNEKEFSRILPQWLSIPVQAIGGTGLEYFQMQHLEQYFNRLVILSCGDYEKGVRGLEQKIGITVIQSLAKKGFSYTSLKQNGMLIEIPAGEKREETYRILC